MINEKIAHVLISLTRFIPFTKIWALYKVRPLLVEPILDLGCGTGDTFWYLNLNQDIVGVDCFPEYLNKARKRKIYSKLVCCDALKFLEQVKKGEYKTIVAFDLIEHLHKNKAEKLLALAETLAETVIISTPYGYVKQEPYDENPHQKHVSHYFPEWFTSRGYTTLCFWTLTKRKLSEGKIAVKEFLAWKKRECCQQRVV